MALAQEVGEEMYSQLADDFAEHGIDTYNTIADVINAERTAANQLPLLSAPHADPLATRFNWLLFSNMGHLSATSALPLGEGGRLAVVALPDAPLNPTEVVQAWSILGPDPEGDLGYVPLEVGILERFSVGIATGHDPRQAGQPLPWVRFAVMSTVLDRTLALPLEQQRAEVRSRQATDPSLAPADLLDALALAVHNRRAGIPANIESTTTRLIDQDDDGYTVVAGVHDNGAASIRTVGQTSTWQTRLKVDIRP